MAFIEQCPTSGSTLNTSPRDGAKDISVAVLGGFFWFLRTTPFQDSIFFFCCSVVLETGSDSE